MHIHGAKKGVVTQFSPEIIVAAQFFGESPHRKRLEPQRRLAIAILRDAIDCYLGNVDAGTRPGRQCFSEAEAWIFSRDRRYCFSFERICDLLDINPSRLRRGVLALTNHRAASRDR